MALYTKITIIMMTHSYLPRVNVKEVTQSPPTVLTD